MRRNKNYEPNLKARVTLESIKGLKTVSQISSEYKVHPNLITRWKKEAIQKFPSIFFKQDRKEIIEAEETIDNLYKQIGMLKVENDFLKKKLMN